MRLIFKNRKLDGQTGLMWLCMHACGLCLCLCPLMEGMPTCRMTSVSQLSHPLSTQDTSSSGLIIIKSPIRSSGSSPNCFICTLIIDCQLSSFVIFMERDDDTESIILTNNSEWVWRSDLKLAFVCRAPL